MRLAKEILTTSTTPNYRSTSNYDSTKWNVGSGMIAASGANEYDNYIAPHYESIRPMSEATAFAIGQIAIWAFSSTYTYVFGIEASTGATNTRRIAMWTVNRLTGARTWNGFITLTLASATAHTMRDFKVDVKTEAVGTVAVSGTGVTGSGTQFNTNRVAIGARIGFGSTDPTQITEWFRVSAKASDTGLTLDRTAPTYSAGTAYVIQEFRFVYVTTNATTTNGCIHYSKGTSVEDFSPSGTTIGLAVSTDDQKAVYWLKDASTVTLTAACGAAIDYATATPTNLTCYVLHTPSAANYRVFTFNLRAALTVASGASTSAFVLQTGTQGVAGTISQNANLAIATAGHGSGNGVKSLYFVTTTSVIRAAVTNITNGNAAFISDSITETPTGGTSTYAATAALHNIEYISSIDAFIVATNHTVGNFSYLTKYSASGTPFNRMFGRDYKYLDQALADSGHPSMFSNQITACVFSSASGNRVFACKQGTTIATNQIFILPFGLDWEFASVSNGRLISPEIPLSNVAKLYRVLVNKVDYIGSQALGKPTEAIRVYARTTNITTNDSTGWTLLDSTGNLSAFASAASIQFCIEFKTIGETCLPARVVGLNLEYEDNTTDSHYAFSREKSSATSKIFAWRFKTAFGGTVPTLRVSLYNDVTGGSLGTDTTATQASGTFEKSTDGTNWTAYNTTDKANETTYIRYTPNSLADNVIVAAYLTQA